ncbi:hypothetical protein DES53_101552 [Roseimicrobium gellanilyticum]|uniref:PEP-CTERM sorting domain-containing protein n=1 Tax=Roseimicrobium gellanilyticum TaxID=748857 RepID=A0A366HTY6_9BACT|nr:hypothetical protein [Roseimicrobium gellanilyticum]RBP47753.1 hypothetical protein DES53_101552 [Roseimicrobium gellanilyticum]
MKKILSLTLCLFALPALADITLGGPGVPVGTVKTSGAPFKTTYNFPGGLYKFVFRGIEAKGATLGAPGSSGTNGNGGQFHLSATVRTDVGHEKLGTIEFRDVQDFNTAPLKNLFFEDGEITFKAPGDNPIAVSIEWAGQGNAHKPDGFFNVLGEEQKHPPVPVGWLTFAVGDYNLAAAGGRPPGTATIIRD